VTDQGNTEGAGPDETQRIVLGAEDFAEPSMPDTTQQMPVPPPAQPAPPVAAPAPPAPPVRPPVAATSLPAATVSSYSSGALGIIGKVLILMGVLSAATYAIAFPVDFEIGWATSGEKAYWIAAGLAVVLGLATLCLVFVGLFLRSLTLDRSILILAGFAAGLAIPSLYYPMGGFIDDLIWWGWAGIAGTLLLLVGSLLLLGGISTGLGKTAEVGSGSRISGLVGRVILLLGIGILIVSQAKLLGDGYEWLSYTGIGTNDGTPAIAYFSLAFSVGTLVLAILSFFFSQARLETALLWCASWVIPLASVSAVYSVAVVVESLSGEGIGFGDPEFAVYFTVFSVPILLVGCLLTSDFGSQVRHGPSTPVAGPVPAAIPAAWYPDPAGTGGQRYWDGQQWTDHTA